MILTNKLNMPPAIVQAVKNDSYTKAGADFSATEIINPPRKTILTERHWDEIEDDVSDRIWSILGQAAHEVMRRTDDTGSLKEETIIKWVSNFSLKGQIDHYRDDGVAIITDWKTTSVWKILNGDLEDWTAQLNIYAYLYSLEGFSVDRIEVISLLRDWSKRKARTSKSDYPKSQVSRITLPLWTPVQQEEYIRGRINGIVAARELPDDHLPPCTPKEMWEKPTVYAVKKRGGKRALPRSLKPTMKEAVDFMNAREDSANLTVEHRPGERVRCADYCSASKFCNIWQEYKKENKIAEGED